MSKLTVRDQAGNVIGTPHIGSRAVLWNSRTAPLRSFLTTELQDWIGYQQELIAAPDWHSDEKRLASSQEELLGLVVTVADECCY
jgi:hypothetical protein